MILPIAVRFLTFGKNQKVVMSYMGGANTGDDRNFTNSFGEDTSMYLANWYMGNTVWRENWKPSILLRLSPYLSLWDSRSEVLCNMWRWISVALYLVLAPLIGGLLAGFDRKLSARFQGRNGPLLLQPGPSMTS